MKRMEANYCDIRISRRVGQSFCAFATQAMRLWTYSGYRNLVAHTERIEKGKNVITQGLQRSAEAGNGLLLKGGAPLRVWSVRLHTKYVLAPASTSDLQEKTGQLRSSPRRRGLRATSVLFSFHGMFQECATSGT